MKALCFVLSALVLVLTQPVTVFAQDAVEPASEAPAEAEATVEEADTAEPAQQAGEAEIFAKKLELAKQMHTFRPAAEQVDAAIESISERMRTSDAEAFKSSMRNLLNYRSIEQMSINAMAETYTEEELQAMVDYYSKPEAQSAAKKYKAYQDKIEPDIVRMIDSAVMKLRTGGATAQ